MKYEVKLDIMGDDTLENAVITEWLADEGTEVEEGSDLIEMTTDKAAFTVPCPQSGILSEIFFNVDDEIGMNDVICIIEVDEE